MSEVTPDAIFLIYNILVGSKATVQNEGTE